MTFFRFGILAAVTSLSSCTLSTAPEPAEFKLSAEALSKLYRANRKTGAVRLYAQEIQTSRDEWGRETHMASGGALLVKEATTPIYATGSSISITPEFSEVQGKGTVKKENRLYIGQDESAKIRIDGAAIVTEGAVLTRGIADEAAAEKAKAREEERAKAKAEAKAQKEAEAVAKAEAKAEAKAQAKEDKARMVAEAKVQEEAEARAKAEGKAGAQEEAEAKADADMKAVADAKAEKARTEDKVKILYEAPAAPKKVVSAPAKKAPSSSKPKAKPVVVSKPKTAPPAPPKAAPALDRSRLLNLMREPTER